MRVAILVPPYPLAEAPAPPLGLTYIAAACEAAGAEVKIFDYLVRRFSPEKLKAELDEFRPNLAGITSVTLNFNQAAAILSLVKDFHPETITVMGGPHVSFTAASTLSSYRGIDIIVMGEGEATIMELVTLIGQREGWDKIRGIAFRREGEIIINEPREYIADLDTLPLPARHLLPLSRYQALGYPISIITGRGCPYRCIFCQGRRMVGSKIRKRSVRLVVDEIEQILSYGITRINVADDLFVSDRKRVEEVCEEILRRSLKFNWSAFARVNTVDRHTLEIMRKAGCDAVSFGVESGNQEILDRIKKNITLDEVRQAVALCREVGITAHTSFMVGLPGETRETLEETKTFAASLGSLYGFHLLAPFPGTTVREEIQNYDLQILTDNWDHYDANRAIVRTSSLSPEEMEGFVKAFEEEIDAAWQKMIAGFKKTNTQWEDLQVAGHFRTELTHRILSEDIIETCSEELARVGNNHGIPTIKDLVEMIKGRTGVEEGLIQHTLESFITAGYIKSGDGLNNPLWFWTHNRHQLKA